MDEIIQHESEASCSWIDFSYRRLAAMFSYRAARKS